MPEECAGFYLDGRTANRLRVTARILPDRLEIVTEAGETHAWPYPRIRRTQGTYAGEQVRFEYGEPIAEALVVSDRNFLAALYRAAPRLGSHAHDPRRRTRRVALVAGAALAAIGLTVAVIRDGVPAIVKVVTPQIPLSWDVQLGDAVLEHFADAERRCDDPALQAKVEGVFAATMGATVTPYRFHLIVLDDDEINAFAAPGGPIVILRGLLRKTASPEELAGVLAHEAQHVIKRHSTQALLQQASTGLLIAALTGDVSGAAAFGLNAAANLGALHYSRSHETEADEEGMRLILAAGIDPAGMIAFYQLLAREGPELPGALSYLSTHPATDERVARLREIAEHAAPPRTTLGSRDNWEILRERCRAQGEFEDTAEQAEAADNARESPSSQESDAR
ncbi:MAG TPA: M48 family metallopeptidase [Nitrospiria bacterium]|nr:M48 family metallopeptidase [Nitrospiria bacterium]